MGPAVTTTPNPLARHYSRFRVAERLLLTGHSHQAWPDVGFAAQQRAWLDAAEWLDDKWGRAAAQAERVREHWLRLLNDRHGEVALGQNTHELVTRLLSALDLRARPKLIATDGEFHTIARQLARLREAGLEVELVPARPVATLAERLAQLVDSRTACVLVSSVLFETAEIVPGLGHLAERCAREGAALLVDAYHHLNVVPFDVEAAGLDRAFVTGGGYKYCQLGEGNAFLRVPADCRLRPVLTGWYAQFETLDHAPRREAVRYGPGASAFAGATYDPTAHYRAAAVFDFHLAEGLTAERLRAISRHQVGVLVRGIEALDADPAVAELVAIADGARAGFVAVRAASAPALAASLKARGVHCDARGGLLRLGPAPYLCDAQLEATLGHLAELIGR